MRETNFLTENNARHVWHPMAHPADMLANPPRIIRAASGVEITDIDGKTVLDGVGGSGTSTSAIPAIRSNRPSVTSSRNSLIIPPFAAPPIRR